MSVSVMTPEGLVSAERWVMTSGGLVGGGGDPDAVYSENFDTDVAGWEETSGNGYTSRTTNNPQAGAGCLACECAISLPTVHRSPAFDCSGVSGGSIWWRRGPSQDFGSDAELLIAVIECDADGEPTGDGAQAVAVHELDLNTSTDWVEATIPETAWIDGGTKARIMAVQYGSTVDANPFFLLDTISVEGTT